MTRILTRDSRHQYRDLSDFRAFTHSPDGTERTVIYNRENPSEWLQMEAHAVWEDGA